MGENTSFIMGIAGIGASFFMVLMGWFPTWLLFGVFVLAGLLYSTKFFATGIAGGFASGVFTFLGWIPSYLYFTAVVLATVLVAVKFADMYVNTGIGGK